MFYIYVSIGLAIAQRLGLEGAKVVVSSRKQANVDRTVQDLTKKGIDVFGTVCHVSKKEDREKLLHQVRALYHKSWTDLLWIQV